MHGARNSNNTRDGAGKSVTLDQLYKHPCPLQILHCPCTYIEMMAVNVDLAQGFFLFVRVWPPDSLSTVSFDMFYAIFYTFTVSLLNYDYIHTWEPKG